MPKKYAIAITICSAALVATPTSATPYNRYHINEHIMSEAPHLLGESLPRCKEVEGRVSKPLCYLEETPMRNHTISGTISGLAWYIDIYKGKILNVSIRTNGVLSQAADFEALTQVLGKPAEIKEKKVQNLYGAHFQKVEACWLDTGGKLRRSKIIRVEYTSCCWYSYDPELTEGNLTMTEIPGSPVSYGGCQ